MFLSFKSKKASSKWNEQENSSNKKFVQIVVNSILIKQQSLSLWMQKISEHLSITGKKYVLVIFFLTAVTTNIFIVAKNIFRKNDPETLEITSIKVPLHSLEHQLNANRIIITEPEYKKIENFRIYMDSLLKTGSGIKIRESILNSRQQLMDSILQFEKIYQLNLKK